MDAIFDIEMIQAKYPEALVDGKIDYERLSLVLLREIDDIQEQMNEKDFQILKITERLDKIGA